MSVSQEQRFTSAREMQNALRDAYTQLQKEMSAQTAAFSAPGEQFMPEAANVSQGNTEPMAVASPESQPPVQSQIQTQVMPSSFDNEISQGETVPYNSQAQTGATGTGF